jgi:general secretion pathway protein D
MNPLALPALLAASLSLVACSHPPPAARASTPPPPTSRAAAPSVAGVHAVRIPLRSQDAREVSGVLRDVLDVRHDPDVRAVLDEPSTNAIVVIGTDRGIEKVRGLLSPALIGDPEDVGVEVVRLQHAEAHRLVRAVEPVAPADADVTVDEPTNSLVVAGPASSRQKVVELARSLDVPAARAHGRTDDVAADRTPGG